MSWARVRASSDTGAAMLMVLGLLLTMLVLTGTMVGYAMAVKPAVRNEVSWNAALGAAQAGVDDYLARLNKNDSYSREIDCTNTALKGPKQDPNPLVPTNSCGWTTATSPGWVDVEPGVPTAGAFHYDVNTTDFYRKGVIYLNSTGQVSGVSRTLQVMVSRGGSTQFLYYTDFEDADPANLVAYPPGGSNSKTAGGAKYVECGANGTTGATYWWQNGTDRVTNSRCVEITFAKSDVLDGAVHFNDTPLMGNTGGGTGVRPIFRQGYETQDPKCVGTAGVADASGVGTAYGKGKCWRSTSSANPYIGTAGANLAAGLDMPDNSDQFLNYPGCQYTGDTRIVFKSDGTMDVWNSTSAGTSLLGPETPAGTNCGDAAQFVPASGQKYPAGKQNVPIPKDMVIYVKGSGVAQSKCVPGQVVNGSASGSAAADVIPQGSGTTYFGVTDVSFFQPSSVGSARTTRYTRGSSSWSLTSDTGMTQTATNDLHPTTFDCGSGNVYLEGTVKGRLTIAAENNVVVTNNLTIASTTPGGALAGTDIIGLVAGNSVVVYHPVTQALSGNWTVTATKSPTSSSATCNSTPGSAPSGGSSGNTITCNYSRTQTAGTMSDLSYPGQTSTSVPRWIYASIQTLRHSFWVQTYNKGSNLGLLSVRGSIAQRWRGIVGTTSGPTGYTKDYSYDTRLQFVAPPYFPQWVNAAWGAKTTGEVAAQY